MESPTVHVLESVPALQEAAAQWLMSRLKELTSRAGRCSVALAGGSTPGPIYARVAQAQDIDWDGVDWYFGDERCVPPDSPDSNFGMAVKALSAISPQRRHLHRMQGELGDRDAAADHYESLLPPRLDLVILGVGEDGHTASLFPGSSALLERSRRVVAVQGTKPPPWRLTVTPPVIEAAGSWLVLASGAGKVDALRRASEPASRIEDVPAKLGWRPGATWFIDQAAAAGLKMG